MTECLEKVQEAEAATVKRKGKGKDPAVQEGGRHTVEVILTVLGKMDCGIEDVDKFEDEF